MNTTKKKAKTVAATAEALRLPEDGFNKRKGHTLATALAILLSPHAAYSRRCARWIAEDALQVLGQDLFVLHSTFGESVGDGSRLSDEDMDEALYRLACRAEAAAFLCQALREANEEGATVDAANESEAAE